MNFQLSMEHIRIPSPTKTRSETSNKSEICPVKHLPDAATLRIEDDTNTTRYSRSEVDVNSNAFRNANGCSNQTTVCQESDEMLHHSITTEAPQNDCDAAQPGKDCYSPPSHHSPLHVIANGKCNSHVKTIRNVDDPNCVGGNILDCGDDTVCESVSDRPKITACHDEKNESNTNANAIHEKELDSSRVENGKGTLCNWNKNGDSGDANDNLSKSPPPRQVSESSSSSSSAESKVTSSIRTRNEESGDDVYGNREKMKNSEKVDGTCTGSNQDPIPNIPLSFSIDVASALDQVLHEYEQSNKAKLKGFSNANRTCSEISSSKISRPCVLQQTSVVDISSGSTSPSGAASLDGTTSGTMLNSSILNRVVGEASVAETPSISVKSSMLVCEESLNRIAQMTAPSKHDVRDSKDDDKIQASKVVPIITGTIPDRPLEKGVELCSKKKSESKSKAPLITGTAAAKFESVIRKKRVENSSLYSKPLSPKPLSPPPPLAQGIANNVSSRHDRDIINAAIAKANKAASANSTEIKRNERGMDILADIISHATPMSNSAPLEVSVEEEAIVPIGQSLSVYSAIAARAGVAPRRPILSTTTPPQEEPQKVEQVRTAMPTPPPKPIPTPPKPTESRQILAREIGKIRRFCAATGDFSAWEDLPCQTYGDTEPRRWCELNIDESIEIPLRRGGRLRVFPNFVADARRARVARSMDKCNLYRQYWRQGVENTLEARIQVLLSSKTNRVHSGSSKRGRPGYLYDGVTMMAQPMSKVPEVESLGRDLAELYRLPEKEWNIGTNLVCYRTGEDHMTWNSNCEQGEVLILCIIAESKNCTRPVLIRPKGHYPLQDGDEEIIVFVGQGDAYEMDGQMQLSYEHCMPKKDNDETAKRSVVIFRHGTPVSVTFDTGSPMFVEQQTNVQDTKSSEVHFGHPVREVPEGKEVFTKKQLLEFGAHRSDHKLINGNSKQGCDSIIINSLDPLLREDDGLCWLQLTSSKGDGGGALFQSYLSKLPVRIFRSSNLESRYAPALYIEDSQDVLHRYDGLYMVRAMWDEQGHETVHPPSKNDTKYTFFLVRYPKKPVDGNFEKGMHYNKISIHELWNEIQKRSGVRNPRLFQVPQPFMELAPVGDKSNLSRKRKENIKLPSEENLKQRKERQRRKNNSSPDQSVSNHESSFKQLSSTRRVAIRSEHTKDIPSVSKDESDTGSQRPKRKSAAAARTYLQDAMQNKYGVKDKLSHVMIQSLMDQDGSDSLNQLVQDSKVDEDNSSISADSISNENLTKPTVADKVVENVMEVQVDKTIEKDEETKKEGNKSNIDNSSSHKEEESMTKIKNMVKKRKRAKEELADLKDADLHPEVKPLVSKSQFDPATVKVGHRINVEYKDVLYKATVRRVRLKKENYQFQIHYDGNKKTNLRWIPSTMVHNIIPKDNGAQQDTRTSVKRQKRSEDNILVGTKQVENDSKKDIYPPAKFNIGSAVYVEYRKLLYEATVKKLRYDKNGSTEYLVHYDGYKKTADRWVKEDSLQENNNESLSRFNQQRCQSLNIEDPPDMLKHKFKTRSSIEKDELSDQSSESLTRQRRLNAVVEESNVTESLDMGEFDAGVEFLPGSCVFVARKDALYLAKMVKRRKVGTEMKYLVHFDDSTPNHDTWVPVSAVYEINPKTRRVFDSTAQKRENLNDNDDNDEESSEEDNSQEDRTKQSSPIRSTGRRTTRKPSKYNEDNTTKVDGSADKAPVTKSKKVAKGKTIGWKSPDLKDIDSGCEFLPGSTIFVEWKNGLYLAKMLKKRGRGENMEYFVHYDGYRQSQDSWVSISSVYEINPQTKRAFNNQKK